MTATPPRRSKISVAMATYNGGRYLQEQLASFAAQSLPPDELVACDDGSSDDTVAILERFKAAAPFEVRIYRNGENLGYARNFEKAAGLARGDIIFFSDQDDVWFPEKLEAVVVCFERDPDAMCITSDQELTDAQLCPTGQSTFAQFQAGGTRGLPFAVGCCTAIRAAFRSLFLPIPEGLASHDIWLHHVADCVGVRRVLPRVLQYHRRHGHNASDPRLNRMTPVGVLERLRNAWSRESYDICEERWKLLELVAHRYRSVAQDDSSDFDAARLGAAANTILREQQALRRRQKLVRSRRPLRMLLACALLLGGGYRYFSGWKSFVRDFLR